MYMHLILQLVSKKATRSSYTLLFCWLISSKLWRRLWLLRTDLLVIWSSWAVVQLCQPAKFVKIREVSRPGLGKSNATGDFFYQDISTSMDEYFYIQISYGLSCKFGALISCLSTSRIDIMIRNNMYYICSLVSWSSCGALYAMCHASFLMIRCIRDENYEIYSCYFEFWIQFNSRNKL
jgi:hypothetical protein